MLYDQLLQELTSLRAEAIWPLVLSTHVSAIEFFLRRGFVERRRMLESWLDVDKFDTARLAKLVEHPDHQSIIITSLSSEMEHDKKAGWRLNELEESGAADVPGAITDFPMDFQDYETLILNSPIMVWDGSFVAKHGDVYVGSSSILKTGASGVFEQGFTVVRPTYRGRGIALAVKSRVAAHAKAVGARFVITHNDSKNIPMLAVNKKVGFIQRAEWINLEKTLPTA